MFFPVWASQPYSFLTNWQAMAVFFDIFCIKNAMTIRKTYF